MPVAQPTRAFVSKNFNNLRQFRLLDAGGHFAALEVPEVRCMAGRHILHKI